MLELQLTQGSPEWLSHRTKFRNASDTPAVTGSSAYKTRAAFLKERATGITPDVDAATQRRFDDGHRFEALARPLMEKILGEDLFPVVGVDGPWSASFDGLTMMGDVNAEHKTLNDAIRACSSADELPAMYREQMEHQMMVSGATKSLFMATKWKKNDAGEYELEEEKHFWYLPNGALRALIVAAWEQFEIDLANYKPEEANPEVTGKAPESLPALRIEVTGMVTASNLEQFKAAALAVFRGINTELKTDQDFADAEKAVKFCKDAEERLDAAKDHALSQTESIDALFNTIDAIKEEARTVRLTLDKLVKAEKENRKAEIVRDAQLAFNDHYAALADRVGIGFSVVHVSFAESIKGLKSLDSMRDKVSVALANAKIEANAIADRIEANRKTVEDISLFPDFIQVCTKQADDFAALLAMRIGQRKEAEEKRLEAERELIRAEEQAKAQREAAEMAAAERSAAQAKALTEAMAALPKVEQATEPKTDFPVLEQKQQVADVTPINEGKTLKLGEINARLGYSVSAEFLASLGFVATTDRAAKLYREQDFPSICRKIADHTLALAFKKAA